MNVDPDEPPSLAHDVNFEINADGYEVWFSDRIAKDHPELVDKCADWLEDQVGVVHLGQIDHRALLADGVLSNALKDRIVKWWGERIRDLSHG